MSACMLPGGSPIQDAVNCQLCPVLTEVAFKTSCGILFCLCQLSVDISKFLSLPAGVIKRSDIYIYPSFLKIFLYKCSSYNSPSRCVREYFLSSNILKLLARLLNILTRRFF